VDVDSAEFTCWRKPPTGPLRLLWSGQAVKLFEFLAVEDALRAYRRHVELVLVTSDLRELDRVAPEIRDRLQRLLADLSIEVLTYQSMQQLFSVYDRGGVIISPRFLDNRYNHGHTEWKITLGMACGRVALCSPVPSYQCVHDRADGMGIRICDDSEAWSRGFDELLSSDFRWREEGRSARGVVERYYSPSAVAGPHVDFMQSVMDGGTGQRGLHAGLR